MKIQLDSDEARTLFRILPMLERYLIEIEREEAATYIQKRLELRQIIEKYTEELDRHINGKGIRHVRV